MVRIKFVGPLPKGRCLRSSLFIMCLFLPLALPFFLGSAFGEIRLLRVALFVWTITLGKILTLDNLINKHIIVVD